MMKRAVFLLLLVCLLTGCTQEKEETADTKDVMKTEYRKSPFGMEPDLSYQVPESKPNVLINQEGYDSKSRKSVIFSGENMSDTFEVIDKKTGKTIYNGKIYPYENTGKGQKNLGYGFFSELEQTGNYYIRTDIIGQSYSFQIQENVIHDLFIEISRNCYENWKKNAQNRQVFLETVPTLLAVEFYGEVFTDDLGTDKSNNGIPDVLDGMKYTMDAYLSKSGEDYTPPEETLVAAGILAKFANIYKTYDTENALEYSKAAEKLWKKEETSISTYETASFFCAAELYKATGNEEYHKIVKTYASKEHNLTAKEEHIKQYGNIAYLSTRRRVNINLCDNIMKESMEKAEDIYSKAQKGIQLAQGKNKQEKLENVFHLCIVEYVVTSHEYSNLIENQLNYFMGCNEDGISNKEELKENSLFLFMLSAIVENDLRVEE